MLKSMWFRGDKPPSKHESHWIIPFPLQLRPPQPSVYMFIFDVSTPAIQSGMSDLWFHGNFFLVYVRILSLVDVTVSNLCDTFPHFFEGILAISWSPNCAGYLRTMCDQFIINLDQLPGDERTLVRYSAYFWYILSLNFTDANWYMIDHCKIQTTEFYLSGIFNGVELCIFLGIFSQLCNRYLLFQMSFLAVDASLHFFQFTTPGKLPRELVVDEVDGQSFINRFC